MSTSSRPGIASIWARRVLFPLPVFLGRVVREDRASLDPGLRIRIRGAPGAKVTREAEEGCFQAQGDLPDAFYVEIEESVKIGPVAKFPGKQYLEVLSWIPGERKTLTLKPWCDLEVRVKGLNTKQMEASLDAILSREPAAGLGKCTWRGREIVSMTSGLRKFRFRPVEGAYLLSFEGSVPIAGCDVQVIPGDVTVVKVSP